MSNTLYVNPNGSGKKDGSSWDNAATLEKLPSLIDKAPPGSTILMLADAGAYSVTKSISIFSGGEADKPITIKGVDSAGNDMNAVFVSNRAEVYSPAANQGQEVFRLMNGADHLTFENMEFQNVSNAFRFAGNITDITIQDMKATNVSRFIDNVVSGSATSASVSHLTVKDVDVNGFAKGAIRLQYDSHDILIERVDGDSQHIDGANFAIGVALDGTTHDVVIRNTSMGNITDTTNRYRNGDGFAIEENVYNVRLEKTYAYNSTDAGYDIKSSSTVLVDAVAEGNTRNFRFWATDTVAENITGINPYYHGGSSTSSNVWLNTGAHVVINGGTFYNDDSKELLFDLNYPRAVLDFYNVVSNLPISPLKVNLTSALHGVIEQLDATSTYDSVMANKAATQTPVTTVVTDEAHKTLSVTEMNLTYTGHDNFVGTGNAHENILIGGVGNDTLDGGLGADTMAGGLGHDTYIVDHVGDLVVEAAGAGTDTVRTGLAFYALGANVENLTFTGTGDFTGTGNALSNILIGGAGNDTLDGGAGADTLTGGLGHDTYIVDHVGDVVVEAAGAGIDTVRTSLSSYTLGANVENLTSVGFGDFTGTGNALANTLIGGAGNDTLDGGAGDDALSGGAGHDSLTGGVGADTVHGDAGNDWIEGGSQIDALYGDAGNDVIIGDYAQAGRQTLNSDKIWGGDGDDLIYGDTMVMSSAGVMGKDSIYAGDGNDTIFGDADVMTAGTGGADWLDGGAGDDWIYGDGRTMAAGVVGGNDRLIGGAGNDHLFGGGGNDVFDFRARGFGNDVIHDFGQVPGDQDKLDFSGLKLKFADLAITYAHGDAIVQLSPTETITLLGVHHLTSSDFIL